MISMRRMNAFITNIMLKSSAGLSEPAAAGAFDVGIHTCEASALKDRLNYMLEAGVELEPLGAIPSK